MSLTLNGFGYAYTVGGVSSFTDPKKRGLLNMLSKLGLKSIPSDYTEIYNDVSSIWTIKSSLSLKR